MIDVVGRTRILNGVCIDKRTGCWVWPSAKRAHWYGQIRVNGKQRSTHRYSYECFVGKIPKGLFVCHHCDRPWCVNPEHLFLGDQLANIHDMIQKGRAVVRRGAQASSTKLSPAKVRAIRRKYVEETHSYRKLGKQYGVSEMAICNIMTKKTWGWVN